MKIKKVLIVHRCHRGDANIYVISHATITSRRTANMCAPLRMSLHCLLSTVSLHCLLSTVSLHQCSAQMFSTNVQHNYSAQHYRNVFTYQLNSLSVLQCTVWYEQRDNTATTNGYPYSQPLLSLILSSLQSVATISLSHRRQVPVRAPKCSSFLVSNELLTPLGRVKPVFIPVKVFPVSTIFTNI